MYIGFSPNLSSASRSSAALAAGVVIPDFFLLAFEA
jgi:hypothetical protein